MCAGARRRRFESQLGRRHERELVAKRFVEGHVLETPQRAVKRAGFQANRHVPLADARERELPPRAPAVANPALRAAGKLQWPADVILREMPLDHLAVAD